MPTTAELITARMAFVRAELMEAIARIDQSMVDWAPAPGMRTIGGQLIEIGGTELQARLAMKGEKYPNDEEVRALIGDTAGLERLLSFVRSVREDTLAFLGSLTPEQLDAPMSFPKGWHENIGLPSIPLSEAFRGIAQHEAYHTGQLVSYLWSRGDNPYRW